MNRCLLLLSFVVYGIACTAQTIINPVFDWADQPSLHVDKVEITNDTTFVYCTYSAAANSWANISGDTYIIGYPSKAKYKLLSCSGLPIFPEKRAFQYDGMFEIVFSFPSIKGSSTFDFIEDSDKKVFNIYGVSLNQQIEKNYQMQDLNRFSNMSSFYDTASDTIKAISYKKDEIEASKFFYGLKSEAFLCSSLGLSILYEKYGYRDETIKILNSLSNLLEESWEDNDLEYHFQNRAYSYQSILYNYDNSKKTYIDAVSLYEKLNIVDNVYAHLLRYIAVDYSASGDEDNFFRVQNKCIDIRRKLGEGKYYLEDLLVLLVRNAKPNDFAERLNIVEKELENLPLFVDTLSSDYLYFLKQATPFYVMNNKYRRAVEICNQRISILEKDKETNCLMIAEAMSEKCHYLKDMGLYHDAIKIGEMTKEIFDSLNVRNEKYKEVISDLAWLYHGQFDYETSIYYLEQLISTYEQEENWISLTESLYTIGYYCNDKGDIAEAQKYLEKALYTINHHDVAEVYWIKQIELYPESIGDYTTALIHYNDMINSIKASIYGCLGFLSANKGNYDDAILYENKAGEYMKELSNNRVGSDSYTDKWNELFASHLLALSRYYSRNRQFDVSNKLVQESKDYYMKGDIEYIYKSYFQQAINKIMLNDLDSAIYFANEALKISESFNNMEDRNRSLALMADIYKLKGDFTKAEIYLSEALDYLESMICEEIFSMTNEQKQRLWYLEEPCFLNYRDIVLRNDWTESTYYKLYNYTLFSKTLLLDTEIVNDDNSHKRLTADWKSIQEKLSGKDIAIEFVMNQDDSNTNFYYALIIDSICTYPHLISLFNEAEFDFEKTSNKNTKSDLDILGNLIWEPILTQYRNIKNIYFSSDGILHTMPIEHCNVDGVGEMMSHYNLYRLSSTKEIIFQDRWTSKNNAILYGGLDYDVLAKNSTTYAEKKRNSLLRDINDRGGFDPLLSTLEEVNEINRLLNAEKVSTMLYTGIDGTEDSFKDLSGKDVNILHLSTHGMYIGPNIVEQKRKKNNFDFLELITNDKDPVKEDIVLTHSFLVMSGGNRLGQREIVVPGTSDGILTAFEISQTNLSKADLVVLSACETGLGDIENGGVYGLQRGFKKAGVKTILMSLDKVDDEATKILMVQFYKNLMEGKTKHQSLKDAQKYLRQIDNGKYNKPEYWASFIMLDGLN